MRARFFMEWVMNSLVVHSFRAFMRFEGFFTGGP